MSVCNRPGNDHCPGALHSPSWVDDRLPLFCISLTCHCVPGNASKFLHVAIFDLRSNIDWVTRNPQKALESGNFSSSAELQSILSERKRLFRCLTELESTERTKYSAHQQNLDRDAFRRGYERIRKAFAWQKSTTENGTFAQEIAAAVERMPKPVRLVFTDKYRHWERWPECHMTRWINRTSLVDIFDERMLLCMRDRLSTAHSTAGILTQLAVQVPLAIHAAGFSTVGLGVQFFYFNKRIDFYGQNQVHSLKVAAESLKVFTFEDRTCYWNNPHTMSNLLPYFGVVLGAGNIEALTISLAHLLKGRPQQGAPEFGFIGALLASLRWRHLRKVNLTWVPFHLTSLKGFIEKLQPETCVVLKHAHLINGTWAEGLDLLRTRANAESWVYSLTGAECDSFSSHQRRRIFDGEEASWANQYVQGVPIRNPFLATEDETGNDGMDTGPI